MFKVDKKDTRTTSTSNICPTFSSVSVVDFKQVNVSWEFHFDKARRNKIINKIKC